MNSAFNKLKEKHGVQAREPFHLPDLHASCDHCERETGTKVFFMKAGLGNACCICGRLRRGKPYLSRTDFESLKRKHCAQGETNGASG